MVHTHRAAIATPTSRGEAVLTRTTHYARGGGGGGLWLLSSFAGCALIATVLFKTGRQRSAGVISPPHDTGRGIRVIIIDPTSES